MKPALTRRTLLSTAAAGTAFATTHIASGWADDGKDAPASLVILQPEARKFAADLLAQRHARAEVVELEADVVRHWRDILGAQLARAGKATAYVPWAQAQILAGLVRETGGRSNILALAPQIFEVSLHMPQEATPGAR